MCTACKQIPKLQSFRKRAILRHHRSNDGVRSVDKVNIRYLNRNELINKCVKLNEQAEKKDAEAFFLKSKCDEMKTSLHVLRKKLREFSRQGSMSAICHQLEKAAQEGKLADKHVTCDLLSTIARNLHVEKEGKRYKASFKMFLEVMLMWGGPRLASFVALNIGGPEIHSIFRWRTENTKPYEANLNESNFAYIRSMIMQIKAKKNIPCVPVLLAEDETAIVRTVHYSADRDILLGFCGPDRPGHQCQDDCFIPVGDGEDGYNNIVDAFRDMKIGTHARAVIINPIHPDLPKFPILLHATCNRFDSDFVKDQWDRIDVLYREYLEGELGPLIGHSSDGDSRRRHLMLNEAMKQQERFRPIPAADGFVLTGQRTEINGGFSVKGLSDQDYIHVHKKLLFHDSCTLMLGNNIVHSNYLLRVHNVFNFHEHGLSLDDVFRNDRQNWASAQRVTFVKVIDCLGLLVHGTNTRPADSGAQGIQVFLKVVWHYVEIFCSGQASLLERIHNAGLVTHFLYVWRTWVIRQHGLLLHKNFLSRETFQDTLLSCHFAVSFIMYMAANFPEVPCQLDLTGSDVVESFFSKNGQWVGNQHTYNFGRMERNLMHMVRLEEIRVNPAAPEFAKPHPKGELIWSKQYPQPWEPADLKAYPTMEEATEGWNDGKLILPQILEIAILDFSCNLRLTEK